MKIDDKARTEQLRLSELQYEYVKGRCFNKAIGNRAHAVGSGHLGGAPRSYPSEDREVANRAVVPGSKGHKFFQEGKRSAKVSLHAIHATSHARPTSHTSGSANSCSGSRYHEGVEAGAGTNSKAL